MEEALDEVPAAVEPLLDPVLLGAGAVVVDDGLDAPAFEERADVFRVVAGIGDEDLASYVFQQLVDLQGFVAMTGREREVERPRFAVDERVELG